jgi:hypothetical protein
VRDEVTIQETAFTNELQRQMVEGPPSPRGGARAAAWLPVRAALRRDAIEPHRCVESRGGLAFVR